MENVITVKNLRKSFKDLEVLKGIDINIPKGSIFALLGSNGAGKTTAVRILSTLSKPDCGTAAICGFDLQKQADHVRRCISLTGQYAAVDEALTGRENLQLIGSLNHLPNVNKRTDELLKSFRLTDDANRSVSTYSGGMRRRIDIAMSLMGSPKVIFLDEPTTGLDPQNRLAMWEMVKELADGGTTIFLTTQYLEEAEYLADHIAILHEGKIKAEGTSEELKKVFPQESIQLEFSSSQDTAAAYALLEGYSKKIDEENDSIMDVSTDGSAKQFVDILTKINESGIPIVRFAQKQPTLEDVFLTLIGEKKEDESKCKS